MKRIVRRPKAEKDLDQIFSWIADQSPTNAEKYIERILTTISLIAETPLIGALRLPNHPKVRSFPVGSHLIFYQISENTLEIIRIIHGARDWENDDVGFQ